MREKIAPVRGVRNECAEFRILDGDLGKTYAMAPAQAVQTIQQTVKTDLGGIRDIGKNGIVEIIVNRFHDRRHKSSSESKPFAVNVRIISP